MKEIECPNCGATFEAREPKCPYCGHINPAGAEAKFLRDLEGTRKKLDKVDDEARSGYGAEVKRGAGSVVKIAVIAAVIIAVLAGVIHIMNNTIFDYGFKGDYAEELTWEHEAFEEYDELYEAGKYEELMERIAEDGEDHDVWNWENYDEFMDKAEELWGEE
jgi:hypothetical protein